MRDTWHSISVGAEEDAQSRLVIDGLTAGVLSTSLDTISQHERAWL